MSPTIDVIRNIRDISRTATYLTKDLGVGYKQLGLIYQYASGRLLAEKSDAVHLEAVMGWLARAQDACGGEGVSASYLIKKGWDVAYPETSGYILGTFLAYSDYSKERSLVQRAIQIGDWEIKIQAPHGGVYSSMVLRQSRVFNTGQVILGWCMLFERTQDQKYLDAAIKAGNYLIQEQETDGTWVKDTFCGARTYHARVDWALLRLAKLSGQDRFRETATKNLRWVAKQQMENGWFQNCGFKNDRPITHVIDYTLRGLLECHLMGSELNLLPGVVHATAALCEAIRRQPVNGIAGMAPCSFDSQWNSPDTHSCLTGNAQIAYFLYRLMPLTKNDSHRELADALISSLKKTQNVDTDHAPIKGAIAGSYPLYKGYAANAYPNWGAKFFADALLMKLNCSDRYSIDA